MTCTDEILGTVVERVEVTAADYLPIDLDRLHAAGAILMGTAAALVGDVETTGWAPRDPENARLTVAEVRTLINAFDAAVIVARSELHKVKVSTQLRAFDRIRSQSPGPADRRGPPGRAGPDG